MSATPSGHHQAGGLTSPSEALDQAREKKWQALFPAEFLFARQRSQLHRSMRSYGNAALLTLEFPPAEVFREGESRDDDDHCSRVLQLLGVLNALSEELSACAGPYLQRHGSDAPPASLLDPGSVPTTMTMTIPGLLKECDPFRICRVTPQQPWLFEAFACSAVINDSADLADLKTVFDYMQVGPPLLGQAIDTQAALLLALAPLSPLEEAKDLVGDHSEVMPMRSIRERLLDLPCTEAGTDVQELSPLLRPLVDAADEALVRWQPAMPDGLVTSMRVDSLLDALEAAVGPVTESTPGRSVVKVFQAAVWNEAPAADEASIGRVEYLAAWLAGHALAGRALPLSTSSMSMSISVPALPREEGKGDAGKQQEAAWLELAEVLPVAAAARAGNKELVLALIKRGWGHTMLPKEGGDLLSVIPCNAAACYDQGKACELLGLFNPGADASSGSLLCTASTSAGNVLSSPPLMDPSLVLLHRDRNVILMAALHGNTRVVQLVAGPSSIMKRPWQTQDWDAAVFAAERNDLATLTALADAGLPFKRESAIIAYHAARHGSVGMLKLARRMGCSFNAFTLRVARSHRQRAAEAYIVGEEEAAGEHEAAGRQG